jgi:flagellar motor switch protein FliM
MQHKPLTIEAVLAASRAAESKLQALSPIFARLADSLGEAAKTLTAKPIKFSFEGFDANRGKGPAASAADPALTCRVRAEAWDAALTVGFDRGLLSAMTEAMLGGSGEEPPYAEERPFSNIERRIAAEIHGAVIRAMTASFQAIAETRFSIVNGMPSHAAPNHAAELPPTMFVRFLAQLWSYSGELLIGLPKAAVLMLQDKLRTPLASGAAPSPPTWNGYIRRRISDADVSLTAVLAQIDMPLDRLANLQRGQVVKLAARLGDPVTLESDGEAIFSCALGQSQGRYVLSIDAPVTDN